MKIGVFDSGIGGITVLSELRRRFPNPRYVYLGDTAHLPYGTKSPAQIEKLSADCARTLKAKGIDALIVACNTASSLALDRIQEVMSPVPVFGVVEPGVEAAVSAAKSFVDEAPILVLATRATVRSQAYGSALRRLQSHRVIEQACPLLVPLIEEGWIDHDVLHRTISEYIAPYRGERQPGVALLGCTHYPWIQAAFEKALPGWKVVNSAEAVVDVLERSTELGPALKSFRGSGGVEWIFTDPDALPAFARQVIRD